MTLSSRHPKKHTYEDQQSCAEDRGGRNSVVFQSCLATCTITRIRVLLQPLLDNRTMTYPAVGEVLLSLALGECDLTELAANGRSWGNRTTTSSDCSVGPKCTPATMARTITPAALDTLLDDTYRCPAGQRAIYRMTTIEHRLRLHRYWPSGLSKVPTQSALHPWRLSPHHPLGA